MILVVVYLAAIVAANLVIAALGPSAAIPVAFVLIGLDLTARDRLHEQFGRYVVPGMAILIVTGGVLSWIANGAAGPIALASTAAFAIATTIDTITYAALGGRSFMVRANGSNLMSAMADSVVFPTLAFGAILPAIVIGQFLAKVVGGLVWSLVLAVPVRRR